MTLARETREIEPSWRISELLNRYPELLDVLISLSPAFSRLRNPVLRRVQSRLVTVEQAARIAGLEPAGLVRSLNAAIGLDTGAPVSNAAAGTTEEQTAAPPWLASAEIVATVDVRPMLERGEEPFNAIMAAVREVPERRAFRLLSSFEPVPLYDVLAKQGFEHWACQLAHDDWKIVFFRSGAPVKRAARSQPRPQSDRPLPWDSPTGSVTIDVSELVPPEPMIRILQALEELPVGGSLLVHHVRRPMHLYPRLDEMGYRHETREPVPGQVQVLIEKTAAPEDAQA